MSSENKRLIELSYKLVNIIPYGVIIANKDGKFIFWNKNSQPVFTERLRESVKENWTEEFGVYSVDKTTKYETEDLPMCKALKGETVVGEKMFVIHEDCPDGVYLKVSAYPILDGNNTIEAGAIIFEDITQEQLAFEEIVRGLNDLEVYLRDELNIDYAKIKQNKGLNN